MQLDAARPVPGGQPCFQHQLCDKFLRRSDLFPDLGQEGGAQSTVFDQQAIDSGFYQYAELEKHPCFESLHGEERFQRMMTEVEARVEEMRRQVDAMEAEG